MIIFKSVKYRNIMSTGNSWIEIPLNVNKTTLIIGKNGAGKSSVIEAITFGLYGKPFRKINKPQLINSQNGKGLEVILDFECNGIVYKIRRGLKPAIFEIWKNGELLNQDASARDYQAYLEQNILKMSYKSFGQVVTLGSSTFVPFMQLTAQDRRKVIEDLLDIEIFSTMNTLLKDKIDKNKSAVLDTKYQIDLNKDRILNVNEHNKTLKDMKRKEIDRIKEKILETVALVEAEKEIIAPLEEHCKSNVDTIKDKDHVETKLNTLNSVRSSLVFKKEQYNKEIQFYIDHGNCPTCKQGIEVSFKDNSIKEKTGKITEIDDAIKQLDVKKSDVEHRLSQIKETERLVNEITLKINEHKSNIRIYMTTLNSLKKDLETASKESDKIDTTKLSDLKKTSVELDKKQQQLAEEREVLSIVSSMLKDGGIKAKIIKQYIPIMNKLINKYLAAMDFYVDFQLNENFEETIKSRFHDVFSYASFSEGEKLRLDLAILFAWRTISKMRNSVSTNLLIMDEIMDSSLDNAGTDDFLKIIKELTSDTNVYIISHKGDQMIDKFDNVLLFNKVKNFTQLETKFD